MYNNHKKLMKIFESHFSLQSLQAIGPLGRGRGVYQGECFRYPLLSVFSSWLTPTAWKLTMNKSPLDHVHYNRVLTTWHLSSYSQSWSDCEILKLIWPEVLIKRWMKRTCLYNMYDDFITDDFITDDFITDDFITCQDLRELVIKV